VFDKRVTADFIFRLSLIWFMLLPTPQLFAKEQSAATKAWNILETGLHDKKVDKRVQALSVLGLMPRDPKAIKTAEDALHDPNPNICRAAIAALGEMHSKTSLPKIKALISHADAKTAVAIAAVLIKFKDPEGYKIYYQLLMGTRKGGGSLLDGIKDKKAVETMGVEAAIGFLPGGGEVTGAYGYFKHNGSAQSNLAVTAVSALADDRDPAAETPLLQAAVRGKEPVQLAALHALAKRGDPTVVLDIEPLMGSDKAVIRYTAAATFLHLLDINPKEPTRDVSKAAQDQARASRTYAAKAKEVAAKVTESL
jgi:HEAT repeat protein